MSSHFFMQSTWYSCPQLRVPMFSWSRKSTYKSPSKQKMQVVSPLFSIIQCYLQEYNSFFHIIYETSRLEADIPEERTIYNLKSVYKSNRFSLLHHFKYQKIKGYDTELLCCSTRAAFLWLKYVANEETVLVFKLF